MITFMCLFWFLFFSFFCFVVGGEEKKFIVWNLFYELNYFFVLLLSFIITLPL